MHIGSYVLQQQGHILRCRLSAQAAWQLQQMRMRLGMQPVTLRVLQGAIDGGDPKPDTVCGTQLQVHHRLQ